MISAVFWMDLFRFWGNFVVSPGGFNGGGSGIGRSGAGGGGASDIRLSDSVDSRIVVAGGGGYISYKEINVTIVLIILFVVLFSVLTIKLMCASNKKE